MCKTCFFLDVTKHFVEWSFAARTSIFSSWKEVYGRSVRLCHPPDKMKASRYDSAIVVREASQGATFLFMHRLHAILSTEGTTAECMLCCHGYPLLEFG